MLQNFEFVYELSVKMLTRQIELESDRPNEVDGTSFRDMLRLAPEKSLIADVEAWFFYRGMRNVSAHTYDHEKARQVCTSTLTFVADARSLLAVLVARNA